MESKAKLFGHPIHPMLIVFPLGLLVMSLIFDLVRAATGDADFSIAAYWCIAAGIIGGLLAAVFGLVDWLAIPSGTRAKRVGVLHGAGNVVVVLLFAVSFLLRARAGGWDPTVPALICSFVGFGLAGITGWLGGELVERLGIGVDDGANVDAPSSLARREARSGKVIGRSASR